MVDAVGPTEVAIRDDAIRLGQFLQVAGAADMGSDAKLLLAGGEVTVNDAVDHRRGRQLHPGDVVQVGGASYLVTGPEST